ncbi:MAG: hypothetical protein GXN96_04770 [Aquificae bacterium]|nr:hypothetical protein [Aquificota bacterium]
MTKLSRKLRTYETLRELFGVLSVVSLNRFRRAQGSLYRLLPFAFGLKESFSRLLKAYPSLLPPPRGPKTLLLFTSELSFTRSLRDKLLKEAQKLGDFQLLLIGRGGLEGYLGRLWNPQNFRELGRKLAEEFLKGERGETYFLYAQSPAPLRPLPALGRGRPAPVGELKRERFYAPAPPRSFPSVSEGYAGRTEVKLLRFLPPEEPAHPPLSPLQLEGEKEELFRLLLFLYAERLTEAVGLSHYASLQLTRFRTTKRIEDNLKERTRELKRLLMKERQERINRELQDIVLAVLAFEEKAFRSPPYGVRILVGDTLLPEVRELLLKELLKLFPGAQAEVVRDLTGFKIITEGKVYDFSAEGALRSLWRRLKEALS